MLNKRTFWTFTLIWIWKHTNLIEKRTLLLCTLMSIQTTVPTSLRIYLPWSLKDWVSFPPMKKFLMKSLQFIMKVSESQVTRKKSSLLQIRILKAREEKEGETWFISSLHWMKRLQPQSAKTFLTLWRNISRKVPCWVDCSIRTLSGLGMQGHQTWRKL